MPVIYQAPGAVDLAREGPVFPVTVQGPAGSVRVFAQIDTGSSVSSVDKSILRQVGAIPDGEEKVTTVVPGQIDLQQVEGVSLWAT